MENYPNREDRRSHLKKLKYFKSKNKLSMSDRLDIGYNNIELGNKIHERNVDIIRNNIHDKLSAGEAIMIEKCAKLDKVIADRYMELWVSNNIWPKEITRLEYREMKKIEKTILKINK